MHFFLVNRCQRNAGALSLHLVESVTFIEAQFENNYADRNGGAHFISGITQSWDSNLSSKTEVIFEGQTLFQNNYANGNRGGLYAKIWY